MNIQINAKNNITEDELRYIYHNLKDLVKEYENSWEYDRYKQGNQLYNHWEKELSGIGGIGAIVGRRLIVKGSRNTLFFSFKDLNKKEST